MRRVLVTGAALLALVAAPAAAQVPLGLEFRGGPAFPAEDLGDAALKTGAGAGFTLEARLMPHVLAYAGWDWFRIPTKEPFLGSQYDVENTGYALGLRFQHPLAPRFGAWMGAGATYAHIELESDGDVRYDSGHELGWEAAGGARILLTDYLALTPGLRYRTLSATLDMPTASVPVDLSYFAAELGFQFSFGSRPAVSAARTR